MRKPRISVGSWVIAGQTYGKVIAGQTYGIVVDESENKTDKFYKVLWAEYYDAQYPEWAQFTYTSDWTNQIKITPQSDYFWKNCVEWVQISSANHGDWCREDFGPTFKHLSKIYAQLDCPVGSGKGLCYSKQVSPLCAYCTTDKVKDVAGLHPCSECPEDHESNSDRTVVQ